jgi:uncharacterized protein
MTFGLTNQVSIILFSMKPQAIRIFISLTLLLISLTAFTQRAVPALADKRVHDEAQILSPHTAVQLEAQLKQYEDSTSNQMAILIISSLDGDAIEDYSLRVAHDEWKLGQSKNDNGVLLLIVVDDHKVRVEVGQGLEGVLTDAVCSQIIRNEMAPNFRRGDYDAGVLLAVNAMVRAIGGEYVADGTSSGRGRKRPGGSMITLLIIFGVIILISRIRGGGNSSGWSSGAGWFIGGLGGGGGSGGGGFGGFSGGGGSFGGGGSSGSW